MIVYDIKVQIKSGKIDPKDMARWLLEMEKKAEEMGSVLEWTLEPVKQGASK